MISNLPYNYFSDRLCSYIITIDNNTIYAINSKTGVVDYSGNNALQSAINVLTFGGEIYIKKGTYNISSTLILADNIIISGEGASTILKLSNNSNINMISASGVDNITIRHIKFDGNRVNQLSTNLYGINFDTNSKNILISNVVVSDFGVGIRFLDSQFCKIDNCHIYDCGYNQLTGSGYLFNRCTDSVINNCSYESPGGPSVNNVCFSINGSQRIMITNCIADGNSVAVPFLATAQGALNFDGITYLNCVAYNGYLQGFYFEKGNNLLVVGCRSIKNDGDGFDLEKTISGVTIASCLAESCAWNGFVVRGGVTKVTFDSCISHSNTRHGLFIYKTPNVTVNGGMFYNNGLNYDGIRLDDDIDTGGAVATTNCIIRNVRCFDDQSIKTQKYGICERVASGADYNIIESNDVRGNLNVGVLRGGDNTIIKNNLGYKTENNILSSGFSITSTMTLKYTFPHGLDITPNKQNCNLSVIGDTDVSDWSYNLLKIESVNASTVVAKINIDIASTMIGATAKLGLSIV